MDIEIVEFYLRERDDAKQLLSGTLHVYLTDINADLRGVFVNKIKDSWRFKLPHYFGVDQETKKKIMFSAFSFVDANKNDELRRLIKEKGKPYIIKKLFSGESKKM